jgi:hypothetical protein
MKMTPTSLLKLEMNSCVFVISIFTTTTTTKHFSPKQVGVGSRIKGFVVIVVVDTRER